jgi:hypothetical protein
MRALQKCNFHSIISRKSGIRYFDRQKMHFHFSEEPAVPITFRGNDFRIPRSEEPMLLQTRHPHDMDSRISFDESAHTYMIDNKPAIKSVTQLIAPLFEQFDADASIEKMMTGPNWPRDECKILT